MRKPVTRKVELIVTDTAAITIFAGRAENNKVVVNATPFITGGFLTIMDDSTGTPRYSAVHEKHIIGYNQLEDDPYSPATKPQKTTGSETLQADIQKFVVDTVSKAAEKIGSDGVPEHITVSQVRIRTVRKYGIKPEFATRIINKALRDKVVETITVASGARGRPRKRLAPTASAERSNVLLFKR